MKFSIFGNSRRSTSLVKWSRLLTCNNQMSYRPCVIAVIYDANILILCVSSIIEYVMEINSSSSPYKSADTALDFSVSTRSQQITEIFTWNFKPWIFVFSSASVSRCWLAMDFQSAEEFNIKIMWSKQHIKNFNFNKNNIAFKKSKFQNR